MGDHLPDIQIKTKLKERCLYICIVIPNELQKLVQTSLKPQARIPQGQSLLWCVTLHLSFTKWLLVVVVVVGYALILGMYAALGRQFGMRLADITFLVRIPSSYLLYFPSPDLRSRPPHTHSLLSD